MSYIKFGNIKSENIKFEITKISYIYNELSLIVRFKHNRLMFYLYLTS